VAEVHVPKYRRLSEGPTKETGQEPEGHEGLVDVQRSGGLMCGLEAAGLGLDANTFTFEVDM
jgi:hypothetical protein